MKTPTHPTDQAHGRRRPTRFRQLFPTPSFRFVRYARLCAALSVALLVACALGFATRGMNLGVDFRNGYQLLVRIDARPPAEESALRTALAEAGFAGAKIVRDGPVGGGRFQVAFPELPDGGSSLQAATRVHDALASRMPNATVDIERADFVGPRIGAELRESALAALALALGGILVYVGVRFSPAYAPGAVIALVHDVVITAGFFALFQWEFDMSVVAALLTIVGYSINDTIVIFDRIRELRLQHTSLRAGALVDQAVNQTLSRTVLTSGTTLLAVFSLLLLGGPTLRGFAAALAIGIIVGTYSSVYVAAPILLAVERYWAGRGGASRTGRPSTGHPGGGGGPVAAAARG